MSQENVEIARRGVEVFNADDTARFVNFWDPDCEFFTITGSQMAGTPYRGHEGLRQYMVEKAEAWTELRFETEEMLEGKDADAVVAIGHLRGEGRGSGVSVEQRIGITWKLRDGKIRHCRAYPDPNEALEAVGLRE
ncbi:MAG: nuclear transport factor 2 family protein [Thermoleophilaceae bacterium]